MASVLNPQGAIKQADLGLAQGFDEGQRVRAETKRARPSVGAALAVRSAGGHVVTSSIERKPFSPPAACGRLVEHHNHTFPRVRVDRRGHVDPAKVAAVLARTRCSCR